MLERKGAPKETTMGLVLGLGVVYSGQTNGNLPGMGSDGKIAETITLLPAETLAPADWFWLSPPQALQVCVAVLSGRSLLPLTVL